MFESLFPIFCFGIVVTGIVVKGLMTAADMAHSQTAPGVEADLKRDTDPAGRFAAAFSASIPIRNDRDQSSQEPHPRHS